MKKSFALWVALALLAFVLMGGGCGGGGGGGSDYSAVSAASIEGTWKIVKSEGTWNSKDLTGISDEQKNSTQFNISVGRTTLDDFNKIVDHNNYNWFEYDTVKLSGADIDASYGIVS